MVSSYVIRVGVFYIVLFGFFFFASLVSAYFRVHVKRVQEKF